MKLAYTSGEYYLVSDDGTPIGCTKAFNTLFLMDRTSLEKSFPTDADKAWNVRIEWWFKDATGKTESILNMSNMITVLTDEYGNPDKGVIEFYDGRMYVKVIEVSAVLI